MLILAFDTSSSRGCAGVFRDAVPLAEAHGEGRARHGDTLLPLVRRVLEEAGVERIQIELLAVGLGPGSFTGLRVGLAVAKGLALGLGRPVVGVPSAQALASAAAPDGGLVASATRAYRGEVYAGLHLVSDAGVTSVLDMFAAEPASAYERLTADAGGQPFRCVGDGFEGEWMAAYPAITRVDASLDAPQALHVARLGLGLYRQRGADDAAGLVPRYVRGADAQPPKTPQRVAQSSSGGSSSSR